ncbi:hypothetical protein A1O3_02996 [Capronia epimyces CBS 606.96]|uniref:Uncharacterized protein n=1 Tax=Capronia epimyces CBS 606.96 TaxID=1182542 RepID=W9Z616_9EURO|nr:uncharacterized protein A1O3_02996 [Capronia epimyces CBS 606.96]EXJ89929.1 hypothetical protein A1O3_02996 [Capronia epimyces CBS 606.96]
MLADYFFIGASLALSVAAFPGVLNNTAPTWIGPIYVPATNTSSQLFLDASAAAYAAVTDAINTGVSQYGSVDNQTTSFSVAVFSAVTNETLFEYHFAAPGLNGSLTKGNLSENTIYRTGSLGKLFVTYAFLVDIGDGVFLDPVTKYLPELKEAARTLPHDPIRYVNWEEVTVGSLASQLSGIGRDYLLGDFATSGFQAPTLEEFEADGYPYIPDSEQPNCTFYGDNYPTCTRAQLFKGLVQHPPVFQSYEKPMYSNLNFVLLGLIYENITGVSLEQAWQKIYHEKLNMTSSTYKYPGPAADAIIPYNESFALFSYDMGLDTPAGGQYTSTKDLVVWGRAILQSSLLPKVLTRRWFTHAASTSVWTSNVGIPFEIYRLPVIADTNYNLTRIVDIYSKSGDVGQYSTNFGLIPDHNLGYSVLSAGVTPNTQVSAIRDTVVDIFVNAAEAAAKAQAKQAFTGTFAASDRNSSLTLTVDGGPGVLITGWVSNGTDFFLNNIIIPTNDLRIYPTGLERTDGANTYRAYRLLFASSPVPDNVGLFSEANDYWLSIDSGIYNNQPFDAFVVGFDVAGLVQSIYLDAFVVNLTRSDAA